MKGYMHIEASEVESGCSVHVTTSLDEVSAMDKMSLLSTVCEALDLKVHDAAMMLILSEGLLQKGDKQYEG